LTVVVAAALWAVVAWRRAASREPSALLSRSSSVVRYAEPVPHDFAETLDWFGRVASKQRVRLEVLEPGRVTAISIADGAPVQVGDALMTLGGPLVESHHKTLEARLASVEERLAVAGKSLELKRQAASEQLVKADELASAREHLADLQSESADISAAIQRLERTTQLVASISGVFDGRRVSLGQDVRQGDVLGEVFSPHELRVVARLFPRAESSELVGRRASIQGPGPRSSAAKVVRVLPERAPSGALIVWIEPEAQAQDLFAGQFVRGTITLAQRLGALSVPLNAVVHEASGAPFVFVQGPAGPRKTPVEVGATDDGLIEIRSGLERKDEVAVEGAYELLHEDFAREFKVAD